MTWNSIQRTVLGEIMKTDISCEILYRPDQEKEARTVLDQTFALFRNFERNYSRFIEGNELWRFNMSEKSQLSPELFALLGRARDFYESTGGLFDPSILMALEREGYRGAYQAQPGSSKTTFSDLLLDPVRLTASKPKDLMIDLGGIGKGYAVDQAAGLLAQHFEHFLIDAGGDIYVRGTNQKEGYPYWAIDVEAPLSKDTAATLLVTDMGLATSGTNRRFWLKDGEKRHHLINPATGKSASADFLSVTVLAPETVQADVWAKTLFLAGQEHGPKLAETRGIPAIFIDTAGKKTINTFAAPYVWREAPITV